MGFTGWDKYWKNYLFSNKCRVEVQLSSVQPGDLLFSADIGHVGMYMISMDESSYTGDYVRINNPMGYVSEQKSLN